MKLPTLIVACIAAAVVVFGVRNFKSEPNPNDAAEQAAASAAAVPASPIKTVTSTSCPSDGCPISCADDDTLLSAFCVSGTKARFADTLKLANGKLTATCGMGASSILAYCGRP
ncbi:hypothetical protein OOZ54_13990 [Rhodopseudomonas palustris]|uniref:hypothetical protein n=1 Tax=Rhodopseudomonas palustris TaxID=1076 RepID=UPI0022F00771|nr:hypothetical protein [Rhodopseudomonas palustris]WBU27774.1 hypothetical protein OOZ54_13990 [Rhodopseudomonas palustris]